MSRERDLDFYVNKLTWGDIILRLTVSLIPVLNVFAIFHIYGEKIGYLVDKTSTILGKPVVNNNNKASKNLDLPM